MEQNKNNPNPPPKPSKWRYVFIILVLLQVAGIAGFISILQGAFEVAESGASGSEFIGLIAFALAPFLGLLAFVTLVGLIIFTIKRRPRSIVGWVFAIAAILLSFVVSSCGAYILYQFRVAAPSQAHQEQQRRGEEYKKQADEFAQDNAKPEITKEEAISLLQTCQLSGFYYTKQTDRDGGNWGELSTTGVVLTKIDGRPFRISIADKLIPELVPIAREAQKHCGGAPQFWHDGSYEHS